MGNIEAADALSGRTVFENPNKPDPSRAVKRKIEHNDNAEDVEGFKGPWAPYANENRIAKPTEVRIMSLSCFFAIVSMFLLFFRLKRQNLKTT